MSTARPNPFVGLRPFERDEAMLFFGRDEQTLELLERLHEKRFLTVVGSSGCGKSSLVRAGLLSKLQASTAMSDRWHVVTMKPGSRPFTELAAALGVPAFAEALRIGGLTPLLDAIAPVFARGDTSLLLLVDQFEELFRFGLHNGDEARREEAAEFVALLLGLARQTTFPTYVVITLRSDFLGDCDAFRGLPEALNESQYLVPRLPRGKRQEAIEGPVRLYGKRIAPRLVDRLLNDGGAAPDQLPVLQHALMRLWDAAGNAGKLDIDRYEEMGGLAEALSKHAGEALEDLTSEVDRTVAEKLFRILTTTDANNRQSRRPRTLAQLMEETGVERERLVQVIDVFRGHGRSFLMPPSAVALVDDTLVDLSHESLIRQWETLRGWVEAEAEAGKVYRRLAEDAERYAAGKGSLLVDRALEAALAWRRDTQPTAAWAKRYGGGFDAAMDFLGESERRDRRVVLMRAVQATLVVLSLLVSVLGVVSFQQWRSAREKTFEANFNLAKMYEEKAGSVLKDAQAGDASRAYAKAWLFNLAALKQPVGDRSLPAVMGRILMPELRTCAFREFWQSPQSSGVFYAVAFSSDGRRLASASSDGTIRVWDVASGQILATLKGHSGSVTSVAFSPAGRYLASGSLDRTIRVWDVASGQILATLKGHSTVVWSVAFSPDGRRLASASLDRTVRIWDVASGENVATLKGHSDGVTSVAFSPDGRRLASASADRMVRVWDAASGESVATLKGHSDGVTSVAFSPDGRRLASASLDRTVRIWDVASGESVTTLKGHSDGVTSVAFSPDGRRLASASSDRTIQIWEVASGQSVATLQGHSREISSVVFSSDGRLASASPDRIQVWDVASEQSVAILQGHSDGVTSVAFSPDGRRLASASSDRTIQIWEVASGQSVATLKGHSDGVTSVAFSPDGRRLASGSLDRTIQVWDAASGQSLVTLQGDSATVLSVAFSPDGHRLASASLDRTIQVWDVDSAQSMATLQGHSATVLSVAFNPDGSRLASGSLDRTIRVWDVASGQSIATLKGHSGEVLSVAFSPDGRRLASASSDRTIRVWDVASGQSMATLQGHSGEVWSVAFSPDGRRLASGSLDRTIRIWDVASGQSVATLQGHSSPVVSVAFSPDGRRLASASWDQTIRFWFASFPEALASPKTRADAFEKICRASLHVLRYRPTELDFEPIPDSEYREIPEVDRPRPLDKDVLEWLLEIGEKLPKEPQ